MKEVYCCVPEWTKFTPKDPFDYPLRSRKEVQEQIDTFPPNFRLRVERKMYMAGDTRKHHPDNTDDRGRVCKVRFDIREMMLQPLQRERFIFLLGPRYNPDKPHEIKIVSKQYATYIENYFKAFELIKELYWEALRAPDTPANFQRNPYLRERITKRKLGRTKEERKAKLRELCKAEAAAMLQMQETREKSAEAAQAIEDTKVQHAKKRSQLGFLDFVEDADGNLVPATQVDDPAADRLAVNDARYQKQIAEQRARKKIEIVTPVEGISREEYDRHMLRSDEHFKRV